MIDSVRIDRLLGPVLDRWLGLGPATTPELVITKDIAVEIAAHDDVPAVALATDHYRPAVADRGPVVLIRTPYDKDAWLSRLYGTVLARRGLQVIIQDVRGRFGSAGEFEPFRHEHHDGLATVQWIRDQPWCDGRVATAGMSYFGYTQWAIGPYVEPRLAAMALGVTAADFRPTFYPGGAVGFQVALSWSASIGTQGDRLPPWRRLGFSRRVARAMATVPPRAADRAAIGKHIQFLTDILEHGEPTDRFWDFLDHDGIPKRSARRSRWSPAGTTSS